MNTSLFCKSIDTNGFLLYNVGIDRERRYYGGKVLQALQYPI